MARQAIHRPTDRDHRGHPKRHSWSTPAAKPCGERQKRGTRHSSVHKSPVDSSCESKAEESRVSVSIFEEKQSW